MKNYNGPPRGYYRAEFVLWIVKLLNEVYTKLDIDPVTLEELREDYKDWGNGVEEATKDI